MASSNTIEKVNLLDDQLWDEQERRMALLSIAHLISETTSINELIVRDFLFWDFDTSDTKLIAKAIENKQSLEILDFQLSFEYGDHPPVVIDPVELYEPIAKAISQHPNLKIVGFPDVNYGVNQLERELTWFGNQIKEIVSTSSPCPLQVLDLMSFNYGATGSSDIFSSLSEELRTNTQVHTIVFGTLDFDDKFLIPNFKTLSSVLDNNFKISRVCVEVSDRNRLKEAREFDPSLQAKLERNYRIYLTDEYLLF